MKPVIPCKVVDVARQVHGLASRGTHVPLQSVSVPSIVKHDGKDDLPPRKFDIGHRIWQRVLHLHQEVEDVVLGDDRGIETTLAIVWYCCGTKGKVMRVSHHGRSDARRKRPYSVYLARLSLCLERMDACSQVEIKLHLTILDENGGIPCLGEIFRQSATSIYEHKENLLGGRSLGASDSWMEAQSSEGLG